MKNCLNDHVQVAEIYERRLVDGPALSFLENDSRPEILWLP